MDGRLSVGGWVAGCVLWECPQGAVRGCRLQHCVRPFPAVVSLRCAGSGTSALAGAAESWARLGCALIHAKGFPLFAALLSSPCLSWAQGGWVCRILAPAPRP